MLKLKNLPNAVTLSRFILVAILIFLVPLSPLSITIFIIAGLTDIFDGFLARRIKDAKSKLGEDLDSMADMFMTVVAVFVLIPAMDLWPQLWYAILVALGFKLLSAVPGLIKHRKIFFLHTISNKVLAMVLFLGGILYFIFGGNLAINAYFVFLITSVFIATLEEMYIISRLDYPNNSIKGFWQVKRINEEYRKNQQSMS